MTDTQNRVLTPAEMDNMENGQRVFVEERPGSYLSSSVHTYRDGLLETERCIYYDLTNSDWCMFDGRVDCRVWSLPQPPTQEELNANPWEGQDDG